MVSSLCGMLGEHKLPVTIRTLDRALAAHLEKHPRVTQSTPTPIAGDAVLVDGNDFSWRGRHGYNARGV